MSAQLEISFDPALERREPQLFEPCDRRLGEVPRRRRQRAQARATTRAPREAGLQHRRPRRHQPVRRAPRTGGRRAHLAQPRGVAGRSRHDQPSRRPERLPQMRDAHLQRGGSRRRRPVRPQSVEQTIRGDCLVGVQQKHRQQCTQTSTWRSQARVAVANLEWAEDAELHAPDCDAQARAASCHLPSNSPGVPSRHRNG